MGRGGKLGSKRSIKRKVRSKDEGSDESDEDFTLGEDEIFKESEDDFSSCAEDESEESLGEFEEEEEEVVRKAVKSKGRKGSSSRKRAWVEKPRSRKRVKYEVEEDDDCDDDDEFVPIGIDGVDDADEMAVKEKNKKRGRPALRGKGIPRGPKRKRSKKSKVVKKPLRKKPKEKIGLGRKFAAGKPVSKGRSWKTSGRWRKLMENSDSEFASTDFEYTISEEEREQMREASEFCGSFTTNMRSSSPAKKIEDGEGVLCQQRKRAGKKGKEKVEDSKNEVSKQVCGICFSEEGNKTVRGTLNCCSHFFCFACIVEWSKVESRCPLCKQRFTSISKPARSNTGFELRTTVIQVPERDQVYQPSEEELMGYLDPYESVICIECQQGGDDAFMLLCDLCDSPAHTYCVGLGREVPEGNWYCEGCRPTALGSTTPQVPNPTPPNQSASTNLIGGSSHVVNVREDLDLNAMYVPDTPLSQGTGFSLGDFQADTAGPRVGAFTVSERRRIQRQIHHILNNRANVLSGRNNGISALQPGNDFLGSRNHMERDIVYHHQVTPERATPTYASLEGRLQNRDLFSARLSHPRGQVIQGPTSTAGGTSVNSMSQAQLSGVNRGVGSRSVYDLNPCSSRSSLGSDNSLSPYMYREMSHFPPEKEQVQSMVRNRLKSLSRNTELGYNAFKDIARSSTHTILAACELEHRQNEVCPVKPPSTCNHIEQIAAGQTSLMKDHCSFCFDSFVGSVVHEVMNRRVHPWFRG